MAGSSHPPGRDRPSASVGTSPGFWPRLFGGSCEVPSRAPFRVPESGVVSGL